MMASARPGAVRGIASLGWGLGLLVASRLPVALQLIPALGTLRGPLGIVLASLTLALAAAQSLGPDRSAGSRAGVLEGKSAEDPRRRASPALLFAVAAILFVTVGLSYASRLRVSGDEPHYLLMAQSLWREGDLDLRDNIEREDFREYTPGPLVPHYGAPRRDGRPFPAHSAGLPAMLAPVYAVGGRLGAVVLIGLFAAGLATLTHALAFRTTGNGTAALAAWASALGPPVFFYSFHVYTEVPSAALLAGSLLLFGEGSAASAALGGLLVGLLPWLHVKMAPAAAALALVAVSRLRGGRLAAFLGVAAAMAAALLAYDQSVFGRPWPLAVYGGLPRDASGSPLRAAAGLLLDRSFGLLPYAPVFLLAAAGIGGLVRRHRPDALPHLATGLAVIAPVLVWRMWWGGQCPPARFLVPLVPLLAIGVSCCVEQGRGLARWVWPLAGLGLALALFMSLQPGDLLLLNRGDRPTRVWAALAGERELARYLPSIVSMEAADVRVAAVWIAAILALLLLHVRAQRDDSIDRLFQSLGMPLLLLLVMTVAIDRWARPGEVLSSRAGAATGSCPASTRTDHPG